jgi:hypothetical protein
MKAAASRSAAPWCVISACRLSVVVAGVVGRMGGAPSGFQLAMTKVQSMSASRNVCIGWQ